MTRTVSSRVRAALESAKSSPSYWVERVKLRFSVSLEQRRRAAGLTYSDLAKRLETSPAYVTKIFRGDSNLTIETMVKLALATGSEVDIRLVEANSALADWDLSKVPTRRPQAASSTTAYSFVDIAGPAANHSRFTFPVAA